MQDYMIALLAMIRDNDPDNVATIRRALRPVDALREQLAGQSRSTSDESDASSDSGEQDAEAGGGLLEELVAEQEAVDAVIGLASGEAGEAGADVDPQEPG